MGLFILLLVVMAVAIMAFGLWVVVTIVSAVLTALVVVGGELLPVLMILVGIWLVWRAIAGNRRNRRRATARANHHMPPWENGSVTGAVPTAQADRKSRRSVPATPVAPPPPPTRELPIDVQVKAEQIQRKADLLLGYADRFPPFSQSLHIVRQTAADYLPRTLEAYLALPGVTDPVVPITGRTALTELRAQLQLLDAKLDDITLDLQQQDLDRMSANRRFLEERFGVEAAADEAQPADSSASASPPETLPSVQPRASAGLGSAAAC